MLSVSCEANLLLGVRNRNTDSFEELYDRYHRLVYTIGELMLGDAASAEDLVQSVFLSVWLCPQAFRGGSFGAWLTCVSRNRARDVLRFRKSHREMPLSSELVHPFRFESDVHEQLEMSRVYDALAELPYHQRSLIELSVLGERTHGETG